MGKHAQPLERGAASRTAAAVVVGTSPEPQKSTPGKPHRKKKRHYPITRFRTPDGEEVEAPVVKGLPELGFLPGRDVTIRYAVDDPRQVRISRSNLPRSLRLTLAAEQVAMTIAGVLGLAFLLLVFVSGRDRFSPLGVLDYTTYAALCPALALMALIELLKTTRQLVLSKKFTARARSVTAAALGDAWWIADASGDEEGTEKEAGKDKAGTSLYFQRVRFRTDSGEDIETTLETGLPRSALPADRHFAVRYDPRLPWRARLSDRVLPHQVVGRHLVGWVGLVAFSWLGFAAARTALTTPLPLT